MGALYAKAFVGKSIHTCSCFLVSQVPSQEWMEPEASCGDGQVPAEDWFRDAEFSMDDAV